MASRVPTRPNMPSDRPAVLDSSDFIIGPPTCWPPAEYRQAAATTTPRSTSRASASIWRGSSLPSAMVTTTTGFLTWSMPYRMALAGPGP